MKRSVLFIIFILTCLPVAAATFVFNPGANPLGGSAPGVPSASGNTLFTYNINNRSDLVAGLPIRVTFDMPQLAGGYSLWAQSNGTFRDAFTITALLGSETVSVSSTFEAPFTGAPPGGSTLGSMTVVFNGPFSLTVPWETDLTALSIMLNQQASVDGEGNGITLAGGAGPMTIATQSVPEPSAPILAASAGLLTAGRRRSAGLKQRRGSKSKTSA